MCALENPPLLISSKVYGSQESVNELPLVQDGKHGPKTSAEVMIERRANDESLLTCQFDATDYSALRYLDILTTTESTTETSAEIACVVCFENLGPKIAHSVSTLTCGTANHLWIHSQTGSICTSCLKQYLHHKMFPLNQEDTKRAFPAMAVGCWSANCRQPLPHHIIQQHADTEIFHDYDQAICQRHFKQDGSILKCASDGCVGAAWMDDSDCVETKIFNCPICDQDTCLECNGLYRIHLSRPCPAGKNASKPLRTKLAELSSKLRLKLANKCPNCSVRYEKMSGCDHIACGSAPHGTVVRPMKK